MLQLKIPLRQICQNFINDQTATSFINSNIVIFGFCAKKLYHQRDY
jgi:hypothetical protein